MSNSTRPNPDVTDKMLFALFVMWISSYDVWRDVKEKT